MTPDSVGPLSRPLSVQRLPDRGVHVTVEATASERAALASDLNLVELRSLKAVFHVTGAPTRVRVTGRVAADITQTCVVSLEDFASTLDEEVDVEFQGSNPYARTRKPPVETEIETDINAPDEIVDGRIDLGALAAEFLALGLDPYPKRPGADFTNETAVSEAQSPFAALRGLRDQND